MIVALRNNFVMFTGIVLITILVTLNETVLDKVLKIDEYSLQLLMGCIICPILEEAGRKIAINKNMGLRYTIFFWGYETFINWFAFTSLGIQLYLFWRMISVLGHASFYLIQKKLGYEPAAVFHSIWNFFFLF